MRYRPISLFVIALAVTAAGCRRVEPPAPQIPAELLWRQAVEAIADGKAAEAGELFARSLKAADDIDRRRDAAVRLVASGEVPAARRLLAGRSAPRLVATGQAIDLYTSSPPLGREGDPFVVGAMADALALLLRPAEPAEPVDAVLLAPNDLRRLTRLWQTWLHLARLDAAETPPEAGRAMILWAAASVDAESLANRGFIVHRPAGERANGWLVHLGSWPVAATAAVEDAVDLVGAQRGSIALYLGSWNTPSAFTFTLRGMVMDQGLTVQGCSHRGLLGALLASSADDDLSGAYVVTSDEAERGAILSLAERLGRLDGVLAGDGVLTVAGADVIQTDYAPRTRWLADLAGYVRYGRAALAAGVNQPGDRAAAGGEEKNHGSHIVPEPNQ